MKAMATASPKRETIEVFVKGDGSAQENGDCPFCQRVLIQLQAKSLPYSLTFIDFENKPAWWVGPTGRVCATACIKKVTGMFECRVNARLHRHLIAVI